jgi:hypothetical protein
MSNAFDMYREFKDETVVNKELKIERNIFGGLDKINDLGLKNIFEVYERLISFDLFNYYALNSVYALSIKEINKIDYKLKDLQRFCLRLDYYSDYEGFNMHGMYISALINNLAKDGDKFTLKFKEFMPKLDLMCYHLDKNIELIVVGNFGNDFGQFMEKGRVFVEGNVGDYLGNKMKKGEIIINGNAGKDVGQYMYNGDIFLNGNYQSIYHNISKGKIYCDGKRIK